MAFGVSANRSLASRGPSPGFRFTLYAIMSMTLMFLDQRGQWLTDIRYLLQGAAYPIQLAVSSPSAAWRWLEESAQTRDSLRVENTALRTRQRELEVQAMRYDALARENAELRGLREALPPVAERFMIAEVMNVEPNSLRQSFLLNVGSRNGVFRSQTVLDDFGLLGQTVHVGPWSCEVILITDPEHAVPVQIERTGVRTIAVGTGAGLALPYLPGNADVKTGDLLITSGLGGVFPQGYPVARVVDASRESTQPLAQVRAAPLARVDRVREVMLVWFRPTHPAAPGTTTGEDLKQGDARVRPQPTPPKPKPVVAPVEAAPAEASAGAAKPGTGTATSAKPSANAPKGKPAAAPLEPASAEAGANADKTGNGEATSASPAAKPASAEARAPSQEAPR